MTNSRFGKRFPTRERPSLSKLSISPSKRASRMVNTSLSGKLKNMFSPVQKVAVVNKVFDNDKWVKRIFINLHRDVTSYHSAMVMTCSPEIRQQLVHLKKTAPSHLQRVFNEVTSEVDYNYMEKALIPALMRMALKKMTAHFNDLIHEITSDGTCANNFNNRSEMELSLDEDTGDFDVSDIVCDVDNRKPPLVDHKVVPQACEDGSSIVSNEQNQSVTTTPQTNTESDIVSPIENIKQYFIGSPMPQQEPQLDRADIGLAYSLQNIGVPSFITHDNGNVCYTYDDKGFVGLAVPQNKPWQPSPTSVVQDDSIPPFPNLKIIDETDFTRRHAELSKMGIANGMARRAGIKAKRFATAPFKMPS